MFSEDPAVIFPMQLLCKFKVHIYLLSSRGNINIERVWKSQGRNHLFTVRWVISVNVLTLILCYEKCKEVK